MEYSVSENLDISLKPILVNLEHLYLNPNNPRIMGKKRSNNVMDERITESKIQDTLENELRKEGLNDIIEKVKKVGFLAIDRIVVRRIRNLEDKYVVLEGNRRVTSLKIIKKEHESGLETLSAKILESIEGFEVLLYEGSDENIEWLLQGLRHINGIKQWGAFQQARFLYEMQENRNLSPSDLDKMTALGRNNISNTIRAYRGWLQAQNEFDGEIEEEYFSLFQEAIFKKLKLKEWLGWEDGAGFKNLENFQNLLIWYVGNENGIQKIKRVVDIRDIFTELLSDENKDIFDRFKNNEDYSIEEARSDYLKRGAEMNSQKDNLDLTHRLAEIEKLYSILSTLPIPQILADSERKKEFSSKIGELKKVIETMSGILSSEL